MLDIQFPRPSSHVNRGDSTFLIQLYAVADKYDVPRLRSLILERLDATCNPEQEAAFIDAILVVDEYTSNNAVWDILLPKIRANLQTLLKNEAFRDVVMSQPAMTLQLLDSFGSNNQIPYSGTATSAQSAADDAFANAQSSLAARGLGYFGQSNVLASQSSAPLAALSQASPSSRGRGLSRVGTYPRGGRGRGTRESGP